MREEISSGSDITFSYFPRKRSRPQLSPLDLDPSLLSFESMDEACDLLTFNPPMSALDDDEYDFATHVVKVKRSGHVVDIKSLWDVECKSFSAI